MKPRQTPLVKKLRPRRSIPCSSFLPYVVTSRSTEVNSNSHLDLTNKLSESIIKREIISRHWKTYRSSSLYKFSYDNEALNSYENFLESYLNQELRRNKVTPLKNSKICVVKISVYSETVVSEVDSPTVMIFVKPRGRGNPKPLFVGILSSVGRKSEYWENLKGAKKFTTLPLFLTHGSNFITKNVIHFLQNHFDSVILPLTFSHEDLLWMSVMWVTHKSVKGTKPLKLEYSIPMKELNSLSFTIDSESVSELFYEVCGVTTDLLHGDEVDSFMTTLENHFERIFRVNISNFQLSAIETSSASLNTKGAVKIFDSNGIVFVIRHLTLLAQEMRNH